MSPALAFLHWLGVTVYGGSLFAFAVLLSVRGHLAPLASESVVRLWRAWGAGIGLSMGTIILSGLLWRWLAHGEFSWAPAGEDGPLKLAKALTFLALWFSSFHLEIWTLEPCRKLDQGGLITDRAAFEAAATRVCRQAWVNVALFGAIGLLSTLAAF